MKTENYPSYIWSILCFNICTCIQNGQPCDIAKWSALLNMHWAAMYFHPCSLKHENYCLDNFYFCWVYILNSERIKIWKVSTVGQHIFFRRTECSSVVHNTTPYIHPGPEARLDPRPPCMRTVAGSILGSANILSWRLVMKSFLWPFSPYNPETEITT